MTIKKYIPVYQPSLSGNEKAYVMDCLESNWISSKGIYVENFEKSFASRIGAAHAVSVSNGTAALHLAMLALGIGEGDEVLVPSFTYIASVNCISYVGAKPVLLDSCPDTWQVSLKDIEKKISPRTRAIMAVHLYGGACDMDAIMKIAQKHQLYVVEDCAEAIGTYYRSRHVGTLGHVSTFSFYGNKTITTGEGGMVVTGDQALADRIGHLRGQGLAAYRQYWHDIVGYNYRMTNICAALGLAQLEQLDAFLHRKREIARRYREGLAGLPLKFQLDGRHVISSDWMFSILVEDNPTREALRRYLNSCGVETRPTFYPVHTMPMYAQKFEKFPTAEKIGVCGMNLPSWPGLSDDDLAFIVSSVRDFYRTQETARTPGLASAKQASSGRARRSRVSAAGPGARQ